MNESTINSSTFDSYMDNINTNKKYKKSISRRRNLSHYVLNFRNDYIKFWLTKYVSLSDLQ